MSAKAKKYLSDVAMSLKGHRYDKSGRWWSGWKNQHWPAEAIRNGFRFYGYDKDSRSLFALIEVTKGSSFPYRTKLEFEKKVKKVAGFSLNRDDPYWNKLPLPESGKFCTGYALQWTRISTVQIKWKGRFPQLGWGRMPSNGHASDQDSGESFEEGAKRMVRHLVTERNPKLRMLAKDLWRTQLGSLRCLACGFDFEKRYGPCGAELIEMHHVKPLALKKGPHKTKPKDLKPLCANCHRILHYKRRVPLTLHALKKAMQKAKKHASAL